MSSFRSSALFLLFSTAATAAVPHDEPVSLDHLVVTASPYARQQSDLAQPTTVVGGRELLLNPASSLGELLAGQPGVSSTYFGPGASRPVIRGLGGDRIRMLTGGVGTFDASVISPDHAVALDPLLIERVEVVRGPATLLYGGNAVGGVVNTIDHRIHTTRPDQPLHLRTEVRASSANNEESGGFLAEGGADFLAWHVDAYRRNAGDVEIPGFAETTRRRAAELPEAAEHGDAPPEEIHGRIPNTALAADGAAAGLSFLGERGYLGFAFSGHNAFYGIPAAAHVHGEAEHEEHEEAEDTDDATAHASEGVRIDLRQRRFDLQGALTQPFAIFREARLKLGVARYRHAELEDGEIGTVFRNRGYDGRVELLHQPLGVFAGTFGWHTSRSDFSAVGDETFLPPSRTHSDALFLFEETETNPVVWQLGARVERQAIDLRDGSRLSRNENTVSASTGLVWTIDETWTLSTSLSRGERPPNTQELFADGPHAGTGAYEIGDSTLAPERSLALDLTLRKRVGFVTGSATAFIHRFDGFIHLENTAPPSPLSELPVYRFVQHDARFHGGELEAIFHLFHADDRQLDLTVGADFVRAENMTTRAPLPRITPARLKTGLTWRRGPMVLGTDIQFVDRPRHLAPNETPTPGYVLADAFATYRLTIDHAILDVFVRATNIADAEARVHTSFLKDVAPLPGRNLTAGIRFTF